ncbi:MAG: glycosyltransferase family 4 protein [Planctomycetota bacterium]
MRIGLVLEQFDPARGGREQWTWSFTQRLLELGHEVHVAARNCSSKALRLPITYHPIQCDPSPITFAGAVKTVLEPLSLDIVHDMGMGWYCDVFHPHGGSMDSCTERKLLFLPAWLRGLKRMANRMLPRHRTFQTLMQRQYADHGQIVLALSRASATDFRRFHGVAPERIRIVYNGVDTERFSPQQCRSHRETMRLRLGLSADTLMVLIVAHNFRLKGVATLLRAMRRLQAIGREVRMVIVGGKHVDSWRRYVTRLGLSGQVTFAGRVDDPLPYYAAADCYIHPTYYDPCSLVVLEAAACGLPLITSRYNGASEMFRDGEDVLLVNDPADDAELAGAMRILLDDSTRQRLGEAARSTILQHSFHRNVNQILKIYQEILDRRGGLPHGYSVLSARIHSSCGTSAIAAKTGGTPAQVVSAQALERLSHEPTDHELGVLP